MNDGFSESLMCLFFLSQAMHSETLIGDPMKTFQKERKERCRQKKDTRIPSAHLPIKTTTEYLASKHKLFISESHDIVRLVIKNNQIVGNLY